LFRDSRPSAKPLPSPFTSHKSRLHLPPFSKLPRVFSVQLGCPLKTSFGHFHSLPPPFSTSKDSTFFLELPFSRMNFAPFFSGNTFPALFFSRVRESLFLFRQVDFLPPSDFSFSAFARSLHVHVEPALAPYYHDE